MGAQKGVPFFLIVVSKINGIPSQSGEKTMGIWSRWVEKVKPCLGLWVNRRYRVRLKRKTPDTEVFLEETVVFAVAVFYVACNGNGYASRMSPNRAAAFPALVTAPGCIPSYLPVFGPSILKASLYLRPSPFMG